MTKQEYLSNVLSHLNQLGPFDFYSDEEFIIKCRFDSAFKLDLTNIYLKSSQNNFVDWKKDFISFTALRIAPLIIKYKKSQDPNWKIELPPPNFNEIKSKIFPILKNKITLDNSNVDQNGILYKQFFGDLYICWVINRPLTLEYIHNRDLLTWNITLDELDSIARENLEKDCESKPIEVSRSNDIEQRVLGIYWRCKPDGLTASRILIRNFYDFFSEHLGSKFYIVIPERDFFMAYPLGGNIDFLKNDIRKKYNESERGYGLSDKLILVDNGKFSFVE